MAQEPELKDEVAAAIRQIADRIARVIGVEVVEISVAGRGRGRVVRVDIDREGPHGVRLDDCQAVSVALGDAIEESGVIADHYTLEVSSPGLDRPIRNADDVRRNTGRRVIVETGRPVNGQSRFRGVLLGFSGSDWAVLAEDGTQWILTPENVVRARQDRPF